MRKLPAFGLAIALIASPAFAQSTGAGAGTGVPVDAAKQALGIIVSIDAIGGSVTLDSGDTFKLPDAVKSTELKVGNRVRIAFGTDPMGLKVVTGIAAVVDAPGALPAAPAGPKPTEGGAG